MLCERELCVFAAALPLPYCETCGPSDITAHSPSKRQSSIETRAFISTPTTTQNKYINIRARCSRGKIDWNIHIYNIVKRRPRWNELH